MFNYRHFVRQINYDKKDNKRLLYFHGNAGNIDQRLPELQMFRSLGINVLGVGYRGYGASLGKPSEKGIYIDGESSLRYATDSLGFSLDSIFICGRSIGTTVAIEISQKKKVAGVILVSPLTSGKDMAKQSGLAFLKPFIGDPFNNNMKCPNIISPVLIIHGTADEVIPFEMGKTIFTKIDSPKHFVSIDGGHHNDLEIIDPNSYWGSICEFIRTGIKTCSNQLIDDIALGVKNNLY